MVFGAILGVKMVPKWIQKSIKKIMDFGIAPARALGCQGGKFCKNPKSKAQLGKHGRCCLCVWVGGVGWVHAAAPSPT